MDVSSSRWIACSAFAIYRSGSETVSSNGRPLIAHVLFRFDTGGLENGVANLINRLPTSLYRHAVIALTEITDFKHRVLPADVTYVALKKSPGPGARMLPAMWQVLRLLQPTVVHTRNLAALEMQPAAWAARVPVRIHSEHGRDVGDLDGGNRKLQYLRRLYSPFVHRYVALSGELQRYLLGPVGLAEARVDRICNGVDAERFRPRSGVRPTVPDSPFDGTDLWWIGTVGRMQEVKNQTLLAKAFCRALQIMPAMRDFARLVMVGDGPLRKEAHDVLAHAGAESLAWLPGERNDVPEVMRMLDAFVLPSQAEGISNTVLEAMASGLPVVATNVGGNAELVTDDVTGWLVPPQNVESMAQALVRLASDRERARAMGLAGRLDVERRFSLDAMVAAYQRVYDSEISKRRPVIRI